VIPTGPLAPSGATFRLLSQTSERNTMRMAGALLLGILLCVGCASHGSPQDELTTNLQNLQKAVTLNVGDGQRAARLTSSINELGQELRSFEVLRKSFRSDFLSLNSRPEATRAEFDSLIEQFNRQRAAIRARVFELHLELTAATTDKEWQSLRYYERKLLTDTGA
jgi:hypothetical protein